MAILRQRPQAAVGLLAVIVAAFNLRFAMAQVGPVIEDVRADTGMSNTVAGVLGTIPVLCFGVFAFAAAPLTRRIGMVATAQLSLALIAAGTLGRALPDAPSLIIALTLPIGVGSALLGVALPAYIKQRFADRASTITGIYAAAVSAGAATAAALMVPLADLLGGWREAFGASAIVAIVALPLWVGRQRVEEPRAEAGSAALGRPGRQEILIALSWGLQSLVFAAAINWIAAVYVDVGWDPHDASLVSALLPVLTCIASLVMPAISSVETRRYWILASGIAMAVGFVAVALVPRAVPILWILILGAGIGAIFPLLWMLPLDLREHPSDVAALTAWMLGLGYILASAGPALVGALRDLTHGFTVPLLVVAAAGLLSGLAGAAPSLRPGAPRR
jgi:CP family cyanate transporter-like MFS transporter